MVNDQLLGRQLANFRIERLLGSGGMAQVYYGLDVKLNRPVAIKVLDARYRNNPAYAVRFVQEARAVAQWRHDHILQVHYADDEGGLYYFVMEYVDGQDLASLITQYTAENSLPPHEDVVRIGRAVASALDYAHKQGVIHRDVKPGNVLIARSGRIVLSDFGLAMDTQQGSLGQVFGTPHYISPEQARRSADAVPQSDLYSLGVILYEMLTGTVPFDDPSATSLALQHLTQAPPTPRSLNPELNTKTEAVLLKALAKTPAERYQTGDELMTALENALSGKTARAAKGAAKTPEKAEKPKGAAKASAEATTSGRKLPPPPPGRFTPGMRSLSSTSILEKVATQPPAPPPAPVGAANAGRSTEPMQTPAVARVPTEPMKLTPTPEKPTTRGVGIAAMLGVVVLLVLAAIWGLPLLYQNLNAGNNPASDQTPAATVLGPGATPTPANSANTPPPSTTSGGLATEAPVATESLIATEAPVATQAEVNPTATTAVAAPPTAVSTGNRFVLFYNDNGFYLLNASEAIISISQMNLERLSPTGEVLNRFEGRRWAQFSATSKPGWCMAIEILESASFTRPTECNKNGQFLTLSLRNLVRNDTAVFWTVVEGSQEFRVMWKEAEVARCTTAAGTCEVYLP